MTKKIAPFDKDGNLIRHGGRRWSRTERPNTEWKEIPFWYDRLTLGDFRKTRSGGYITVISSISGRVYPMSLKNLLAAFPHIRERGIEGIISIRGHGGYFGVYLETPCRLELEKQTSEG